MAASDSDLQRKVNKGPFNLDSRSTIGLSVVVLLIGFSFWLGKASMRQDDGVTLLTAEIDNLRKENKTAATALEKQIDNLKLSMDLRAANRDKEIDTINKRLDSHDLTLHELFLLYKSVNK